MNIISRLLPDALVSSPLVSGGGLSGAPMSLQAVVSSPLASQGAVAAQLVMPSAAAGTFNTSYVLSVVFETKAAGAAGGKLFINKHGQLIGETIDGEQVELAAESRNA